MGKSIRDNITRLCPRNVKKIAHLKQSWTKNGLIAGNLSVSGQLLPRKIAHRLGLGFGLGLGAIFLGGNCPRNDLRFIEYKKV